MRMTWDEFVSGMTGVTVSAVGQRADVTGVTLDSRTVQPGHAFFCVRGGQVDGHDFADAAMKAGAGVIVAERTMPELWLDSAECGVTLLTVENTVHALGELAHAWRWQCAAKHGVKVVGVTGTAGKTTVKEVLAAVLATQGPTAKNHLNHNNQIGLPQSMLATRGDEAFWVMEIGISRQGDMDELGAVLEPDVAVILNAGTGHIEGLGSNVARHKARLLNWLAPGGQGFVGGDYPELVREAAAIARERSGLRYALYGTTTAPAVCEGGACRFACRAEYLGPAPDLGSDQEQLRGLYRLHGTDGVWDVVAPFQGRYGAENVSAIASVALSCGLDREQLGRGLLDAQLPAQRFACSRHGAWCVVDDSYNANPLSCARMLESVADMARREGKALVCVLGEMLELGSMSSAEHEQLGMHLAASGARLVVWHGGQAGAVRAGLAQAGFGGDFVSLETPDAIGTCQVLWAMPGGVILFKGSRGNHLETGVARFVTLVESSHAV